MAGLDELPFWLRTTLTLYPRRRVDPVPCSSSGTQRPALSGGSWTGVRGR